MTDKIFLDTTPLIYYLQQSEGFYDKMLQFWDENDDSDFVASTVTITEYMTVPCRDNNLKLQDMFRSFVREMDIDILPIDEVIAYRAAQIRAKYQGFKAMDSLQLAAACVAGCSTFLTNDKQLCQFKEVNVITVDDIAIPSDN